MYRNRNDLTAYGVQQQTSNRIKAFQNHQKLSLMIKKKMRTSDRGGQSLVVLRVHLEPLQQFQRLCRLLLQLTLEPRDPLLCRTLR